MKFKTTIFEKYSVCQNDEWIGDGRLIIRKDQLTAVKLAQIQTRSGDCPFPVDFMKDVLKSSYVSYYGTAIMVDIGEKEIVARFYRETDGAGTMWIDEKYADIVGSLVHLHDMKGFSVAVASGGLCCCAPLRDIEDMINQGDVDRLAKVVFEKGEK